MAGDASDRGRDDRRPASRPAHAQRLDWMRRRRSHPADTGETPGKDLPPPWRRPSLLGSHRGSGDIAMVLAFRSAALGGIENLFEDGTCTGLSDARLLERFVT